MLARFVRWLLTLLGGVLVGASLVLHGQLTVACHMRDEVDHTFFLWRAVGRLTFMFQGDAIQSALILGDLPERVLVESERAAWSLLFAGVILLLASWLVPGRVMPRPRVSSRS
jgi:hypothetical protein